LPALDDQVDRPALDRSQAQQPGSRLDRDDRVRSTVEVGDPEPARPRVRMAGKAVHARRHGSPPPGVEAHTDLVPVQPGVVRLATGDHTVLPGGDHFEGSVGIEPIHGASMVGERGRGRSGEVDPPRSRCAVRGMSRTAQRESASTGQRWVAGAGVGTVTPNSAPMTAITLDGEALAASIKDDLRARVAALKERGVTPGLGTILVGDDGPSARYVSM